MRHTWFTCWVLLGTSLLSARSVQAQGDSLLNGLVSYWNFDGDLLDTATGASSAEANGGAGNGVLSNRDGGNPTADFVGSDVPNPDFGQALDLDGVDQYVLIDNDESLYDFNEDDSFSFSAWFRVDGFTKSWQALMAKGEGNRWRIHRRGGENIMTWNGGNADVPAGSNPNINDGGMHHIAGVSVAGVEVRMYIDGELVSTGPAPTLQNNAAQVRIGDNPDTGNRTWDGLVDDVGIWRRELSEAEIGYLWNNGQGNTIILPCTPGVDCPVPGDVNGDRFVNNEDFAIIQQNFYQSVTTREEGDLAFDGVVDFLDFRAWKDAEKGGPFATGAAAAVPEPGTLLAALMSLAALCGLYRPRRRVA